MVAEKFPELMKSSDSGSTNSDGKKEKNEKVYHLTPSMKDI